MNHVTDGLVLLEVHYRDSDKMLTILSRDLGKVSASCRGARSRQGSMRAGTQLLTYSNFTLFENRGRYSINAAEPIEMLTGLRKDILRLSLGTYFAEVLEAISEEEVPTPGLLTTGLNCLYALSVKKKPQLLIKATFEFRMMMLAGYTPNVMECLECGSDEPVDPVFQTQSGRAGCTACLGVEKNSVPLCSQSLSALRYILLAEPKKILSYSLDEKPLALLANAAERYLLSRLEREFSTLKFYKSLLKM